MKKNYTLLRVVTVCILLMLPSLMEAQNNGGALVQQIDSWKAQLAIVVKSVIGLSAIGGGCYAYFKMQSDEGGNGKKALGSFAGALIFAALMFQIIDFFLA